MKCDKYDVIFYRKTLNDDVDKSAEELYEILCLLRDYGDELSQEYFPSYSKMSAERFELSKDNILHMMNVKRTFKDRPDVDLSLFSSKYKDDDYISGFDCRLCSTSELFTNLLWINLPKDFSGFGERQNDFRKLYDGIIDIYKPSYVRVTENNFVHFETPYKDLDDMCRIYKEFYISYDFLNKNEKSIKKKFKRFSGIVRAESGMYINISEDNKEQIMINTLNYELSRGDNWSKSIQI